MRGCDDPCMGTDELRCSIITAPIAAIDRRALSQAWYSALHRAGGKTVAAQPPRAAGRAQGETPIRARSPRTAESTTGTGRPDATRRANAAPIRAGEPMIDRRAPRSSLSRCIERRFLDPRANVRRATFELGAGGARVHVVLQSRGASVRLVAFCAREQRDRVARALAQARFALARHGIALDATTEERP
jgi:hypothetical protein